MSLELGTQVLSGPPVGSLEYFLLPAKVRHGFLRSIVAPANGWTKDLHKSQPPDQKRKRQFGHAA